ncbi:MAG TPA: hypothetical protein VMV04_20280 [Thermodesulfobacteriota bacterium]|nr:hypothetical protein [Thermodesulfobacteriota bacterium]
MRKKNLPDETRVPVRLTLRERDLIRSSTFLDPAFGKGGVVEGKCVTVDLSLDEIGEIQGYVAAEANHTRNSKLERELNQLFDKLQALLDEHGWNG